jgi:uncharacterized protein YjhX (UPF0386 family)
MDRLTQINGAGEYFIEDYYGRHYGEEITKLGKLEDLEEQLGCPLDVYYKLHNKAHIYDSFGTPLRILNVLADTIAVRPETFKEGHCFFYLKDYKKTWWLKENREE